MKISLCIPQYNRIQYLLKNLAMIADQTYPDIEVVISDDASSDTTQEEIAAMAVRYKYPLIYYRNTSNIGYDANLRRSMELATGRYCVILGNDDSIFMPDGISRLVRFLEDNDEPGIGFSNYVEEADISKIVTRAHSSAVIGSGQTIALKYYRSFSFVAGIIFRKDVFDQVNTNKADGSIYVQLYFAVKAISSGCRFFTWSDPLILKDLRVDDSIANSYRDKLIRKWKDFKPVDGGLKSFTWAVTEGFRDAGIHDRRITYTVLRNIYRFTYPYWLIDYRMNKAFVSAIAMMKGMRPGGFAPLNELGFAGKTKIYLIYYSSTGIGLLTPVLLFARLKHFIYKKIKR
jgi:glycosyltransferase involved in cell wall biosynthesis